MPLQLAERVDKLPPYLFAEIDRKKQAAMKAGRDVIDLGIGDPDTPTPDFIIEALTTAAADPATHRYPLGGGEPEFRREIAAFFARRFDVKLDPDGEVYPTIGSKEAIAHLPLAWINPGDVVLVPEPCYPPYRSGALFAGGVPVGMDLLSENGFLPDFGRIEPRIAEQARILWLNYPNSPTGVLAPREFYRDAVAFAKQHNIILAQDAAYTEMYYGEKPLSILEIDGARDVAIEFHSLSKTFNMTGWRVGFAAGNREIISGLAKVKANVDSGVFTAIQRAGAAALRNYEQFVPDLRELYRRRRDVFCDGLNRIGWPCTPPAATFFVWIPVPAGQSSEQTAGRLLDEADIVCAPGNGFGRPGEGFIRATLTVSEQRLAEAVERIAKLEA